MKRCCICGKEGNEHMMVPIQTSRTQWRCWECYKKGQGEVTGFETLAKRRKIKEANKK